MRLSSPWFKQLLAPHEPPCVSMYLPLHRTDPGGENGLRFREQVERSLTQRFSAPVVRRMVEKLHNATTTGHFWSGDRNGIALFASEGFLKVIDLHQDVEPLVMVADTFHVKPLIRIMQSAYPYHVLTLTQRRVEMFLGTGPDRLVKLDPRDIPQNPSIVSGMVMGRHVDSHRDMETAPNQLPNEGSGEGAVSLELFMRAVDRAVWEQFSRDAKLPVILTAVEKYHPQFRAISKNQYLLDTGVKHDPQQLDAQRLLREAWAIMEPRFTAEVKKVKDQLLAAKAHQQGSDELIPVLEAAAVGRVGWLLVDGSRQVPGRVDPGTGRVIQSRAEDPRTDDVLDDLAERVLKTDGEVLVLPHEMMPNDTGLAAIYRY